MTTDLQTLGDEQLADRFNQLYDELPDGGHFGWDWPTLRLSLPDHYAKMHAVHQEARRRLRVNGRFLGIVAHAKPCVPLNKQLPGLDGALADAGGDPLRPGWLFKNKEAHL